MGNISYFPGCSSIYGFSSTTGQACIFAAAVSGTTTTTTTTTPGMPTTGMGDRAGIELVALAAALIAVSYSVKKLFA